VSSAHDRLLCGSDLRAERIEQHTYCGTTYCGTTYCGTTHCAGKLKFGKRVLLLTDGESAASVDNEQLAQISEQLSRCSTKSKQVRHSAIRVSVMRVSQFSISSGERSSKS
jgi:hypothetical protein